MERTPPIFANKDWHSRFCENYTHVHPKTIPNMHVKTEKGQGIVGGLVQDEGMQLALGELSTAATLIALYVSRYADLDDLFQELNQAVKSADEETPN